MALSSSLFLVTAAIAFGTLVGCENVNDTNSESEINVPLSPVAYAADDVAWFCYVNGDPNNPVKVAYGDTTGAHQNVKFNAFKKIALVIHGWLASYSKENPQAYKNALIQKGYDVCLANYASTLDYTALVRNCATIGNKLSTIWKLMVDYHRINTDNAMCVGHSMGAHICGKIKYLRFILGLDPAGPSMTTSNPDTLNKNSSAHVVTVMTSRDAGGSNPLGCVNHVMYGGTNQPECKNLGGNCNHMSSWNYAIQGLNKNFSCRKCQTEAETRNVGSANTCESPESLNIYAERTCANFYTEI